MASRSTVPAVEYRNLLIQLGLRRELDPDNQRLLHLMQELVAIGDGAGALTLKLDASEETFSYSDGAHPIASFDWANGEIPVTSEQDAIVQTVAEITRIPE